MVEYKLTRNKIIELVYGLLNIYNPSDSISYEDFDLAVTILNLVLKSWQQDGINLWVQSQGTLFLTPGVSSYELFSSGAHATDDTNLVETYLSSPAVTGDTILKLNTVDNVNVNDNIGVVLSNNSLHWSTVSTINTVDKEVTIADALTDNANNSAYVAVYTAKIDRPIDIPSMRYRTGKGSSINDRPLQKESQQNYFNLPNKNSAGTPTLYYVDKQKYSTIVYLYNTPDKASDRIKFTYTRQLNVMGSPDDNPDIPDECGLCLVYNTAMFLAPFFGSDQKMMATIGPIASSLLSQFKAQNKEYVSVYVQPDIRTRSP